MVRVSKGFDEDLGDVECGRLRHVLQLVLRVLDESSRCRYRETINYMIKLMHIKM